MTFDVVVCVTKTSYICVSTCKLSALYLFFHLLRTKISHSIHCNNQECLTVLLSAEDEKVTKCNFCIKTCLFTQFSQNSSFRLCVTCFSTHEENSTVKYKRFWIFIKKMLLLRKCYWCFFKMSAFGVGLMAVSIAKMRMPIYLVSVQ